MQTANCVVCVQMEGKRVPATVWSGWVLLLDDERKEEVIAGFCDEHRMVRMPHKPHISRKQVCVGVWLPDYGIK